MLNSAQEDIMAAQNIDKAKLQKMLPKGSHHRVTDEIIALVHNMEKDTGLLQEYMEERLLSYLPVLRETKVDLKEYINAIKYCNLKQNMDNQKAWEITFPEKYAKLVREGRWNTSHVSMYNSGALVVKIDTQMALDIKIQYAPLFHKQLMKQVELAAGWDAHGRECSPTVQHLASSKILDLLEPDRENTLNINLGQSEDAKNSQEKMYDKMTEIALSMQKQLEAGRNIEDIQRLNLTIDADIEDDEDFIDIEENENA